MQQDISWHVHLMYKPHLMYSQWDIIDHMQDKVLFLLWWQSRSQVSLLLIYSLLQIVLHIQDLLQLLPQQPLIPRLVHRFLGRHPLTAVYALSTS